MKNLRVCAWFMYNEKQFFMLEKVLTKRRSKWCWFFFFFFVTLYSYYNKRERRDLNLSSPHKGNLVIPLNYKTLGDFDVSFTRDIYIYIHIIWCCFAAVSLQKNLPVPAFFSQCFYKPLQQISLYQHFFENAGIGNPITAAQNQRFKKCCNRRPITTFFKNSGIGGPKALG